MLLKEFYKDKLYVRIFSTRLEMGQCAASDISKKIKELLMEKDEINIMFAAAPSQNEVLSSLCEDKDIDFSRINAFHMDEYIGISPDHPAGFAHFLKEALFGKVKFKSVNYLDCTAADADAEAARYSKLLRDNPLDICVLGVGENGHIAFNDPGVADFNDKLDVKVVDLDDICRMQQVNDGCFESIDMVPKTAMTVTIPMLTSAKYMCCSVPAKTKADAVKNMLSGEVSTKCPASILTTHENAFLYLDADSSALIM